MEDDVNVDLIPVQTLLDLWDVAWGCNYVHCEEDSFWGRVGARLAGANWTSRVSLSNGGAVYKRKVAVSAAATKE